MEHRPVAGFRVFVAKQYVVELLFISPNIHIRKQNSYSGNHNLTFELHLCRAKKPINRFAMKKLVILSALFISFAATAQNEYQVNNNLRLPEQEPSFTVNVTPDSDAGFTLVLDNPTKKKIQVWIRHSVLGTISDTTIYKDKLTFHYNLDGVEDGKYIITVTSGKEKITKEIEMKTTTVVSRSVTVR